MGVLVLQGPFPAIFSHWTTVLDSGAGLGHIPTLGSTLIPVTSLLTPQLSPAVAEFTAPPSKPHPQMAGERTKVHEAQHILNTSLLSCPTLLGNNLFLQGLLFG